GVRGSAGGLLRIETRLDVDTMRAIAAAQGLPPDYVEPLDAAAASAAAGIRLASPAWHYPGGGWVDPRGLAQAWLATAGESAALRLGVAVASLRRSGDEWRVCDGAGATIAAAEAVVLCDGGGGAGLLGTGAWPLRRQRGEISALPEQALPPDALPRLPLAGHGHVLPGIAGAVWFGTSTRWDDGGPAAADTDRAHNVDRLTGLLGLTRPPAVDVLSGRAAIRWLAPDRLPLVGAVPAAIADAVLGGDASAASPTRLDQPRFVARAPGLFVFAALGSRGIAAASLGAEILAALIAGAPVPAEADLIDAVDPARFLSRAFRRGEATRAALSDQPPVGPIAGSFGG
ncbi:MAG: FAD-dependent 5-carboxymethylaminomethyl-2-thiouridine(34) oxidoreductase MnmC, partial [Caldimonas sp.]